MMVVKLWIVIILFFAEMATAQSFYTSCTPPSASATIAEINSYNACVANNRASAQSSGTTAAQSFTLSGSTVVLPTSASSEQNAIYNQNATLNSTSGTPLTAEQIEAVTVGDTGAVGALGKSMRANTEGETTYLITAESTLAEGLGKLSMAGECASVSTSSCYNQRADLYATGAAFLLAQRQAQDQVAQHQEARNIACTAKNQITTEQESCGSAFDSAFSSFAGAVSTSVSGITVTVAPGVASSPFSAIFYDPITGACSPPTAPGCKNLVGKVTLPSPQLQKSVRDILKQKYAGTKGIILTAQNLYSTNTDGSVSVKGGGVYSRNDFSDLNKLKTKGLSDSFAQNLMKSISSFMSGDASSTTGTDSANANAKTTDESSSTVTTNSLSTTSATEVSAEIEEVAAIDREPASLKIQVGEEFIGVAKDNIFKIINRRYKSEEKDDFFY